LFRLRAVTSFAATAHERKKVVFITLLLGAVTLAVFSPAMRYDFLNYDDDLYVYQNRAVLSGVNAAGLEYALTSYDAGTWAPLTWLSYELDGTLLGPRASSYHATNILLHVAAGLVLFFALLRMVKSLWVATLVAGIFLLHPLRTESVVWIAERKDVLCALFWTLGLLAYAFYTEKPNRARWTLVFLCVLSGMMSKMMMVTFPFVLLLLDVWPLNRVILDWSSLRAKAWPLIREKIPFFIAGFLAVWVTSRALHATGTLDEVGADVPWKLLRVPENYLFYIGKIFCPTNLSILYPIQRIQTPVVALAVVLLVALTIGAVGQMRKRAGLIVGWLWFLGVLVPVIGFVTFGHFFVGDRYAYIPSIGLTLAVAVTLEEITRRFQRGRWLFAMAILALCAFGTSSDLPRWRNSFAIYDAALRVGPHHVAYNNRGTAFLEAGDKENAMSDFNSSLQMRPGYALALNNRGSLWIDLGNNAQAIKDCTKALETNPALASAWNNRGNARNHAGDFAAAMDDYNQAIRLKPDKALYYNNRAANYFSLKRYAEAKADLERCSQLGGEPNPGLVQALRDAMRVKPL
jgi:protein O-mannosyl-transferase